MQNVFKFDLYNAFIFNICSRTRSSNNNIYFSNNIFNVTHLKHFCINYVMLTNEGFA